MFGFKIIKESKYNDLLIKIQYLQKKNKQLNDLLNPPTGDTVVSKNYDDINEAFCNRCIHYKSFIKYIDEHPFMKLKKYCDLKCNCKNFEDIRKGVK